MSKATYVFVKDCKIPYPVQSGNPRNPSPVVTREKRFRKGDLINAELKHSGNEPSFILAGTRTSPLVIPISLVKKIVTKEIVSEAAGSTQPASQADADAQIKKVVTQATSKVQYFDAALIGALIGFAGVIVIKKYTTWLNALQDKEKKLAMAGIIVAPALLGAYMVYRKKNTVKVPAKPNKPE